MESLLQIVGLLGIGGLISSYLTILLQRRSTELKSKQEYKETRYKCIVLLMRSLLEFGKYQKMLINHGYVDIKSKEDLVDLLQDEQMSSILYASRGFIKVFGKFINTPNKSNLVSAVIEMRKDLWRLRGKLDINDIFLNDT